ncbi:hypothetical protein V6N12_041541 [Hibiscus sabdariffa]|uniref:Uncharacterized protein n=1 Tax=Hibiscus sabdariffa TaxID=183260 RepID=A0ABR1Z7D0_9ROSI
MMKKISCLLDIHLLDADDVETIVADANEGNDLDVEDNVWSAAVARLGLGNEQPIWGYVGPETEQPIPSYPAYEPPSRMYDVNYTAMCDREHQAHVFGFSSSSNYGELDRMISLQSEATSMRVRTFDPNGFEFSVRAMIRGGGVEYISCANDGVEMVVVDNQHVTLSTPMLWPYVDG